MNNQFKRILDLVRRTGDRMVVTDPEGKDAVVIMDFDEYEAMIEALAAPPAYNVAGSHQADDGGKFDYLEDDLALEDTVPPTPSIQEPAVGAEDLEPEPPNFSKISEETQKIEEDGDDEQFYLEPVE